MQALMHAANMQQADHNVDPSAAASVVWAHAAVYAQSFPVNRCRVVTGRLLPFSLGVDDKRAYQALSKNVICHDSKVPLRLLLL